VVVAICRRELVASPRHFEEGDRSLRRREVLIPERLKFITRKSNSQKLI
jgi:hypothetical protein